MAKGINITPEKFSEWLDTLPSDAILGDTARCKTCPLAQYFTYLGYKHVSVGPWDANLGSSISMAPVFALPAWSVEFIARFDDSNEDTVAKAWSIVQDLMCDA